jgi:hypothetical protein
VKFVATKKGMKTNFPPLSFAAVFGSGMGKNPDPGSRIRDKHPGSATLLKTVVVFVKRNSLSLI